MIVVNKKLMTILDKKAKLCYSDIYGQRKQIDKIKNKSLSGRIKWK